MTILEAGRAPSCKSHEFLRNAWYPIAWENEVGDEIFSRTILGERIIVYRTQDGDLAAIGARCPHRFAPLRLGKVCGNAVECPYHGLHFGPDGKCAFNPHDKGLPNVSVPSYPLTIHYGMIFLWMGEHDRTDPALLPKFDFMENPKFEFLTGTIYGVGHYELYSDNILDLTHAEYLHPSLKAPIFLDGDRTFTQEGNQVWARLFKANDLPSEMTQNVIGRVGKNQDHWVDVRWDAPAAMCVDVFSANPGERREQAEQIPSIHIFTPESERATFYFWIVAVDRTKPQEFKDAVKENFAAAFEMEDKPMIAAQFEMMDGEDFWDLSPLLLRGDNGAVRARRTLQKLIAAEQAGEPATTG